MGRGTLTPQEEELKKVISNNIRTKIKEEGISQAEFARRAGIPPTTLSGYIKGVTRPNAGNLQKISDTLGLLKSDIDPSYKQGYSLEDWNNNKKQSHLVKKITEISSQLEEPRQKIVLDTASSQLEEQERGQLPCLVGYGTEAGAEAARPTTSHRRGTRGAGGGRRGEC